VLSLHDMARMQVQNNKVHYIPARDNQHAPAASIHYILRGAVEFRFVFARPNRGLNQNYNDWFFRVAMVPDVPLPADLHYNFFQQQYYTNLHNGLFHQD